MELMRSKSNPKDGFVSPDDCSTTLKTTKEPVFLSEVVYDGQVEQGVEFDYVLPDYYPDIFKVLKCSLTPCVVSHSISGNQLYCDGVVYIKVLYLSRESNTVNCIEQRYTYSKTVEMGKSADKSEINSDNAVVHLSPKTDYCNCRAVSGRRIDVRGAVSCKVKVTSTRESQMITGVSGLGTETRNTTLNYCGEKLTASRQFVVREDIETGVGSSGISSIVHHCVNVTVTDYKIVANKVIVKGEALIKALYLKNTANSANSDGEFIMSEPQNENEGDTIESNINSPTQEAEVMEAVIPLSQIMDLSGVNENHVCFVNLSVMDCDLEIKAGDANTDDYNRLFSCDLTVDCTITAHLEKEVMPLTDMYSVDYESSFMKSVMRIETMPHIIERQLSLKGMVECTENVGPGNLQEVYDSRCDISSVVCRVRENNDSGETSFNELVITGQANMQIMGRLDSNSPVFIEKTEPFELVTEMGEFSVAKTVPENFIIEPNLQVVNTTFSLSSENRVELRVVLKLSGCLYQMHSIEVIKEISVNQDAPKAKEDAYALKLYYAEKNEEVWNIAKRYNTGAGAIIAENDMECDRISEPCMLLIPIV